MPDFCPDTFEERAAIMEFDGGLSRYQAEVEAAKAQGVARWQALKAVNDAKHIGNSEQARDNGQADKRHGSGNMPALQPASAQQVGPLPVGDVQTGRDRVALLALRGERR